MGGDWMRGLLALIIVVGFLAVIGAFFVFPIKGDNTLFNVLLGALATVGFASVVGYYFGSSSGSKEKDAALIRAAGAGEIAPATPASPPTNVTAMGKGAAHGNPGGIHSRSGSAGRVRAGIS